MTALVGIIMGSTSDWETMRFAAEIKDKVVLKIVSPDILHKSDAGGVMTNLKTQSGLTDVVKFIETKGMLLS